MSKMLDKVSKILNQAENAGTPEEAEAFMAKAQELATINGIELAVARMHQAKKERAEEPEERRIQVNPYSRRHNRKHFMDLAIAIAEVNDCKVLIGGKEHTLFAMGFPSDIDVVEALYVHLAIEMVSECDRALKNGENKEVRRVQKTEKVEIPWDERDWGGWNGRTWYDENPTTLGYWTRTEAQKEQARQDYLADVAAGREIESPSTDRWGNTKWRKPVPPPTHKEVPLLDAQGNEVWEEKEVSAVDGRVFRNDFYAAFVGRMRARLWEIKRAALKEAGALEESSSTAVALRDKKKEVTDFYDDRIKVMHLGSGYGGASSDNRKSDYTGAGRRAGAEAADRAPITSTGRGVES